MLNFIVVEDNAMHRKNVEKIVLKFMMKNKYEFGILSFEKETSKLIEFIKNNEENAVYILDFELPNTNAIDLARKIRKYDWRSPIIILTAHAGMAFETFKQRLQILDFVAKQYQSEKNLFELFEICMKQLGISKSLKVSYNYTNYNIPYDKILYIYRDTIERKVIVVTVGAEYRVRMTMKAVKQLLPRTFKYSHRACIINTLKVEAYDWKNFEIYFGDGKKTNLLSKTHKKELMPE